MTIRSASVWLFIQTAKLVPAVLFLILWMVMLSAWLAPYIDRGVASLNEAMCARGLTTQCPPPCEYLSQKGCVPTKARF